MVGRELKRDELEGGVMQMPGVELVKISQYIWPSDLSILPPIILPPKPPARGGQYGTMGNTSGAPGPSQGQPARKPCGCRTGGTSGASAHESCCCVTGGTSGGQPVQKRCCEQKPQSIPNLHVEIYFDLTQVGPRDLRNALLVCYRAKL